MYFHDKEWNLETNRNNRINLCETESNDLKIDYILTNFDKSIDIFIFISWVKKFIATAHGTKEDNTTTGFLFQNCKCKKNEN